MFRLKRNRAGFTLLEIVGVLVISAIVLAVAVPAVAHAYRVHAAEAVLKNDLRQAVLAYEQAYLEERTYPGFGALQARGFRLSPQIALDSQAVRGERVYLRLRHLPSGQRCAVDYSRSSPRARNRADCYGGGQPKDTAVAVGPNDPDVSGRDTFGIIPPSQPRPPTNPLALEAPTVSAPPARVLRPGATQTETFTVTNRSSAARSFRFEVTSSNPGVATTTSAPAPVTLVPGVPTAVSVTYAVAENALAGSSSVIPLRAVDEQDERWAGTGSAAVSVDEVLTAPAVAGPGDRVEAAGQEFDASWTVRNVGNAARTLVLGITPEAPTIRIVSASGTGRVPVAPGQVRTVTARVRIDAAAEGGSRGAVTLLAADAEDTALRGAASFVAEAQVVLAAPAVETPGSRGADPGETVTLVWPVRNASNQARTFVVTPSADPAGVEIVGVEGGGEQRIGRGEVRPVMVSYRVREGVVAGRAHSLELRVRDRAVPGLEAAARTVMTTNEVVRAPTVRGSNPVSGMAGESGTALFVVTNNTNANRRISLAASVGAARTATARVQPGVDLAPFASATVPVAVEFTSLASDTLEAAVELRAVDGAQAAGASSPVVRVNRLPSAGLVVQSGSRTLEPYRFAATAADADGVVRSFRWGVWNPQTEEWTFTEGGAEWSHTFVRSGVYRVYVAATDNNGGVAETVLHTVEVRNRAPLVEPTFTPDGALSLDQVSLKANGGDADGSVVATEWFLVDPAGAWTPLGSGEEVRHRFPRPGTWRAYAVVTDDEGARSAASSAPITVANRAPVVKAVGVTPLPVKAGTPVELSADAEDADGTIVARRWFAVAPNGQWVYIGDAATPAYAFPEPGEWYVYVDVEDDAGAHAEAFSAPVSIKALTRGCRDAAASNYDPGADTDDRTLCQYRQVLPPISYDVKTDACYCGTSDWISNLLGGEKREKYKIFINVRQPVEGNLRIQRWRVLGHFNLRWPNGTALTGSIEERNAPQWFTLPYEETQADRWWPASQQLFGVKVGREGKERDEEFRPTTMVLFAELEMSDGSVHVQKLAFPYWSEREFTYTYNPVRAAIAYEPADGGGLTYDFSGVHSDADDPRVITSYTWDFGDFSPRVSGMTATHTFVPCQRRYVTLSVRDQYGVSARTGVFVLPVSPKVDCRPFLPPAGNG